MSKSKCSRRRKQKRQKAAVELSATEIGRFLQHTAQRHYDGRRAIKQSPSRGIVKELSSRLGVGVPDSAIHYVHGDGRDRLFAYGFLHPSGLVIVQTTSRQISDTMLSEYAQRTGHIRRKFLNENPKGRYTVVLYNQRARTGKVSQN